MPGIFTDQTWRECGFDMASVATMIPQIQKKNLEMVTWGQI